MYSLLRHSAVKALMRSSVSAMLVSKPWILGASASAIVALLSVLETVGRLWRGCAEEASGPSEARAARQGSTAGAEVVGGHVKP